MELTAYLLTTPYLSDILGRVFVTYDRCSKMCGIKSCVHRKVAGLASEVNPLKLMLRATAHAPDADVSNESKWYNLNI